MSFEIETAYGKLRRVNDGQRPRYLWQCTCGKWAMLSDAQLYGHVSVDHASMGCPNGYHETHNFAAAILATSQAEQILGLRERFR